MTHLNMKTRISSLGRSTRAFKALAVSLVILFTSQMLPGSENEWKQALPGYQFKFARDHASHPEYKIEWWYYTGNLTAEDGRRFGYQLTFFRIGVDFKPVNPSRWAVRDLFMTHLAVSDIDGKQYHYEERMNRAGVGWAGALNDSYPCLE